MSLVSPLAAALRLRRAYREKKRQARVEKRLGLDIKDRFYYPDQTVDSPSGRRYSVISAVYGVEKYLDDMMASLLRQTLDFRKHIQVILVDDGSTDRSGAICDEWAARFPDNVQVIHKENSGQAGARNAGLPLATGDWVTYTDPDDFLDRNYLLEVDRNLDDQPSDAPPHLVVCNFTTFHENKYRLQKHPLSYRFDYGIRSTVLDEASNDLHMAVNSAFFRRNVLLAEQLKFENLRPNFEDAQFVARHLLASRMPRVLFVSTAQYWYRKRSDGSSSLDGSWEHPGAYTTVLDACLQLLGESTHDGAEPPRWLQRTITYHLAWQFKFLLNNHVHAAIVPEHLRDGYIQRLHSILSCIEPDVIIDFELAGLDEIHRLAMLHIGHPDQAYACSPGVVQFSDGQQQVCLRYHYIGDMPDFKVEMAGLDIAPIRMKIQTHHFLGLTPVRTFVGWYDWAGDATLAMWLNGNRVDRSMKWSAKAVNVNAKRPRVGKISSFPRAARVYRWLACSWIYQSRFQNAWLFMDRDTQADDNAEHLYRYIKRNHSEINAWLVLRKTSHDWARLKADGFRLLAYGSLAHKMALINAKHLISSHADHYVLNYLPRRYYNDLMRWDYTFLQHGVTQNDLSSWLNGKPIRNFITAAKTEYESICVGESGYKFTSREVALTGFPRHDQLLSRRAEKTHKKKSILIMPTWRQGLVGDALGKGSDRAKIAQFTDTDYYRSWQGFLTHPNLQQLAQKHDLELQFFPHANLKPYLKDFETEHVRVLGHADVGGSMQELFLSAALLITDYSSVAFEMAYLECPVLYYQFDEAFVFGGGHTTQKGYFDYRRDGFGPVCTDQEQLLASLEAMLQDGCEAAEPYATRMRDFFAFRDGKCSERVFRLIRDGALETDADSQPPRTPGASEDDVVAVNEASHQRVAVSAAAS